MTVRTLRLDTPGGALAAVEAAPESEPTGTVVFVTGYTGSKEDYVPLLPFLVAAGYRVLAYDQRGQYESEGPDDAARYTVADFADDLGAVLARYDRPHLVGHSFGGLVARAAVLADPAAVGTLVLLDSLPGGGDPRAVGDAPTAPAQPPPSAEEIIAAGGREAFWQLFGGFLAGQVPEDVFEFLRHRMERTTTGNLVGIDRALRAEPDRTAALAATGVPLAVVYGEHDDVCPPPAQRAMAAALGVDPVVLADAGHNPNTEQPEATAKALVGVWAELAHGGR